MKTESTRSSGRKGGLETLKRHGKEHFQKLGRESWIKRKKKEPLNLKELSRAIDALKESDKNEVK